MRTRQKRVATDTWRSLGCRTTPLEHWSKRKPTVEPRWAKQQTKTLRPKPTKINSFMSGPSLSLTLCLAVGFGLAKSTLLFFIRDHFFVSSLWCTELGSHYANRTFYLFCIHRDPGRSLSTDKNIFITPVV